MGHDFRHGDHCVYCHANIYLADEYCPGNMSAYEDWVYDTTNDK